MIEIVASRLSNVYRRPAAVFTQVKGFVVGSVRSHDFFDVYRIVEQCRDLLVSFGGHPYAVGLSLRPENLPAFTERFQSIVGDRYFMRPPHIPIDAFLHLCDIDLKLLADLQTLSPFGQGNEMPVFCTLNVRNIGKCWQVGKENSHLHFDVMDDTSLLPLRAIALNLGRFFEAVVSQEPFHICYTLEASNLRFSSIRLFVKDIRTSQPCSE